MATGLWVARDDEAAARHELWTKITCGAEDSRGDESRVDFAELRADERRRLAQDERFKAPRDA